MQSTTTITLEYVFFLVIPLWTCKKQFCDKIVSMLDMKTIKDIFLKLYTNIKNH